MNRFLSRSNRRIFFGTVAPGAAFFTTRGAFAEELVPHARLTEGPFYPDKLPLDTDNDLIIINDSITPAVGEITHLTGRMLDADGQPDPERHGRDLAVRRQRRLPAHGRQRPEAQTSRTSNFQGFGRFLTGSTGEYYFRTIKPVPYPGRPAPHIHFKVKKGDGELLTTQFFINGHPGNDVDGVSIGGLGVVRPGAAPGRLQADQGLEDRRTGRALRHRPWPDPGRPPVLIAMDGLVVLSARPCAVQSNLFSDRGDPMRTRKLTVTGLIVTGGLLIAASLAVAQRPGGGPRPPGDDLVVRMMEFDKDQDGKLTKAEVTDDGLHRLFDRADADKDGVVTKEELTALATREAANNRGGPPGGGPPGGGPGGPMGADRVRSSRRCSSRGWNLLPIRRSNCPPFKRRWTASWKRFSTTTRSAAQNHAGARSGQVRPPWRRPWPRPRRRWPSPASAISRVNVRPGAIGLRPLLVPPFVCYPRRLETRRDRRRKRRRSEGFCLIYSSPGASSSGTRALFSWHC